MIEIERFRNEHVRGAARVFTANFMLLRQEFAELPAKYENADIVASMLCRVTTEHPSAIAISNNRIVGYMTGISNIPNLKGSPTGVYIPEWAHSATNDRWREQVYYDLYTFLSKEWLSRECNTHIITYYAPDHVIQSLFHDLCFGLLVVDGIRPLDRIAIKNIPSIITREATEGDLPGIIELGKKLVDHLNASPIFLHRRFRCEPPEEQRKNFLGSTVKTMVAEQNGRIVSCLRALLDKGPGCDTLQDSGTLGFDFAYTIQEIRRLGVASNLLGALIDWGLSKNMRRCTVDFESQNKEAKEFWLKHFKPICYSAIRKIDDRVEVNKN